MGAASRGRGLLVSINEIELYRLGLLLDEIFHEENRVGIIVWKQAADNNPTHIATEHEYILCYAKNKGALASRWTGDSVGKQFMLDLFRSLEKEHPEPRTLQREFSSALKAHVEKYDAEITANGQTDLPNISGLERYFQVDEHYSSRGPYAAARETHNPNPGGYIYDVVHPLTGKVMNKPSTGYRFPPDTFDQLARDDKVIYGKDEKRLWQLKKYLIDIPSPLRSVIELDARAGANTLKRLFPSGQAFPNPKPVELIQQFLSFAGDSDALVLDPFAGSGTTAHAVLRLNKEDGGSRRFILIEEGSREDRYCRTLTAPRVREAIRQEELSGGFRFDKLGRRLDRSAILELERGAITNLIMQTDSTGTAGGLTKVSGNHVIAQNRRRQAICLFWNGRKGSTITSKLLREMYQEVDELGLERPLRVYGSACEVSESESFRFCQIPDEILLALELADEGAIDDEPMRASTMEALELSSQFGVTRGG